MADNNLKQTDEEVQKDIEDDIKDIKNDIKSVVPVKTDEDLRKIVEMYDKNEFKGVLTKSGVKVVWSKKMTKKEVNVVCDDSIEIRVSYHLLSSKSSEELVDILRPELSKALTVINGNDFNSLEKSFDKMKLKDKQILPKTEIFKVKTEMEEKVRKLELKCIIDQRLDELDPKPDIQILFKEYDKRYFGGLLSLYDTEVCWADQLVTTSGNSYMEQSDRPFHIRLSRKLLKFKGRRHLVETLLHEMIHVFVDIQQLDNPNREHGPGFVQVMDELNKRSGSQITIYHSMDKFQSEDLEDFRRHFLRDRLKIRTQFKSELIKQINEE